MKSLLNSSVLFSLLFATVDLQAEGVRIDVQADKTVNRISPLLTGACIEDVNHEIYGGIYSQMIFGESFQEPAPIPSVKGFKAYGGQWQVQNGVIAINGGDGPKLISDRAALEDGTVSVELFFANADGANAGLIVRADKPGLGADSFIGYEVALDASQQSLRLARHRENFEPIKDVPCRVAVGKWILLEVKLDDTTIEILVDGKTVLKHDDGAQSLPAGTVGLRAWHKEARYRNLQVKTGEKTESLPFVKSDDVPAVSGTWRAVQAGSAKGKYAILTEKPFVGVQSQQVSFESGEGQIGIENQGLNRWGMCYVAGKPYQGVLWARAEKPTTLYAVLESRDGAKQYAETEIAVPVGDWQRMEFSLTPNGSDKEGRFALKLKQPGAIALGYAFLQPGDWGRFKGLPVRRDVAEGLIEQGVTVLRYGGSMINHPEYRWKKMVGPRDRRPPNAGTWYRYSTNGWGILDFMDFCEAAGFEYIPDFNIDEKPQDMIDFIEYAKGPAESEWGGRRAKSGHPQPYRLHYLQLGNEERVDENYAAKFEKLAETIWAKDPEIILIVGDFCYGQHISDPFNFGGSASGITSLAGQQRVLKAAKKANREVWFDIHVTTEYPVKYNGSFDGLFSFYDALDKIADGAKHKVVVFEFNAGNHGQKRALANALGINVIERDGRLPIVASANCLQPDGQNDNDWNQGLLFLNPSQVWLQPPGYVTQIISRNYQPRLVKCQLSGAEGKLDVNAKSSDDGKTLVLQAVNPTPEAITAEIDIAGFTPAKPAAQTWELAGEWEAVNTAEKPNTITPKTSEWQHGIKDGKATYTFPPNSLTVIRME